MALLQLGNIAVDVVQKDIKNIYLSVYPPTGRVRISAPDRMDMDTIRVFTISKLGWIKKQQAKFKKQEREAPREYLNRESRYYQGKRYLLKVIEKDAAPEVVLRHSSIELQIRRGSSIEKMKTILDSWYRERLKETIPELIAKWEKKIQVQVNEFGIKRMKTRWGTCSRDAKRIWLNLELAKKSGECLEYIVVHEMVHLLERNHNDRFVSLMNEFMPKWRFYKEELNKSPLQHENWDY